MDHLIHHAIDLAVLFAVLGLTALALAGWGRLAIRCIGLAETPSATIGAWIGFAFVIWWVELLHFVMPVDWRMSLGLALVGWGGYLAQGLDACKARAAALTSLLRSYPLAAALALLLLLVWCSRDMAPPTNSDSGLYHMTSIRWLNEYAIVPGLGNLHSRLAFNQSFFGFAALLNIAPFWQKGYAAGNLFLLLLASATVLEAWLESWFEGFFLAGILLGIAYIAAYVSSPTPDITVAFLQVVIFLLLRRLLLLRERPDARGGLYGAALFLLCTVIVTVKLSALIFALACMAVALVPLYGQLGGQRRIGVTALAACAVIGLTHLARGYVLSGMPLYPVTLGGAWSLDWAVPARVAREEAAWVYSWARNPGLPPEQVLGNWHWLHPWLSNFPWSGRLMFGGSSLLMLLDGLLAWRRPERLDRTPYLLYVPLLSSIVFWFLTAPTLRFLGTIPVLLCVLSGWLLWRRSVAFWLSRHTVPGAQQHWHRSALSLGTALASLGLAGLPAMSTSGWQPMPPGPTKTVTTDSGLQLLLPLHDGQCWDSPLPCTPYPLATLRLRHGAVATGDLSGGFSVQQATSGSRNGVAP